MNVQRFGLLLLLSLVVTACSVPQRGPRSPDAPPPPGQPAGRTAPSPAPPSTTKPPESGASAPIPDRVISLKGQCKQTEEDGFREDATLTVSNGQVQTLAWQLWVGKRGSCTFKQADFKQVQTRPHIELAAIDGSGCKLMVWQDPRRVTLAHNGCQKRCTGGIYEEAWPVMFDPSSGACARGD